MGKESICFPVEDQFRLRPLPVEHLLTLVPVLYEAQGHKMIVTE